MYVPFRQARQSATSRDGDREKQCRRHRGWRRARLCDERNCNARRPQSFALRRPRVKCKEMFDASGIGAGTTVSGARSHGGIRQPTDETYGKRKERELINPEDVEQRHFRPLQGRQESKGMANYA